MIATDLDAERVRARDPRRGPKRGARGELDDDSRWSDSADAVLICASSAEQRPGRTGGDNWLATAAPSSSSATSAWTCRAGRSTTRSCSCASRAPTGPAATTPPTSCTGSTTRSAIVRWTEQRNMEAFLEPRRRGAVASVRARHASVSARRGRERVRAAPRWETPARGCAGLREKRRDRPRADPAPVKAVRPRLTSGQPRFGLIGAGSFATSTLIPGLVRAGVEPGLVASASGLSAAERRAPLRVHRRGLRSGGGDRERRRRPGRDRHPPRFARALVAAEALRAGKLVYVEKPLALDWEGLRAVHEAQLESGAAADRRLQPPPFAARRRTLASFPGRG